MNWRGWKLKMDRGDVVLEGVVGSTAYGLATPESDIDTLGIYQEPTATVLSLGWNQMRATRHTTDPDSTHHEVGKFMKLVVGGNPTVTELLWLNDYSVYGWAGAQLVRHRRDFLGWKPVRDAYIGYASQQVARLERRKAEGRKGFSSDLAKRTAKHGRHCWRLLLQAEHAMRTGEIRVDVSAFADEIFSMGNLAESDPAALGALVERYVGRLKRIDPVLPERPNVELANHLLFRIRMGHLFDDEETATMETSNRPVTL